MESYEEILQRMQNKYAELTGVEADDASDIGIRLKVLAGEVFSLEANVQWLKNQMFVQTATEEQLDYHAQKRGLQRKTAVCSEGTLKFSRQTALDYDVAIPSGTVCSTAGTDGVRYETTQDAVLEAGDLYVSVNAKSCEGGKDKNASVGTVTIMVTPPTGISSVTNDTAFTGCAAEETDEELRARILDSYKNISNGTNAAFYKEEILKYAGVHSVSVVPLARGAGTVDIYVAGKGQAISSSLKSTIQNDIENLREINVDIQIKDPTILQSAPAVTIYVKEGYNFSSVRDKCVTAITEYFNNLKIGEPMYISKIGEAIYHVEGVENYSYPVGANIDAPATSSQLITLGGTTIYEGE